MLASEDDDSTTSAFDGAFVVQRRQDRPADLTASETDDRRKLERHIAPASATSSKGGKTERGTASGDRGAMGGRDGGSGGRGRRESGGSPGDDDGGRPVRPSRTIREADDRTNLYRSSHHDDDSRGSSDGSDDGSGSRDGPSAESADGLASLADLTSYGNSVGSSAGSGVPILHPHHKKRRDTTRGGGKHSDRESDVEMPSSRDRRASSRTRGGGGTSRRRQHHEDDYEAVPPHHRAPSRGRPSGRHDRLARSTRRSRHTSHGGGFDPRAPLASLVAAANSFADGLNLKTVAMCVLGMFAVVKMGTGPPPPPNAMHGVSPVPAAASEPGGVRGALASVPREEVKEQESLDSLMKEKDGGGGEAGDNEEKDESEAEGTAEVEAEEEQEEDVPVQSDPIPSAPSGGSIMDAGAAAQLPPAVHPGGMQQYPAQMAFQQAFPQQQMYAPAQGIVMQPQMLTPAQQQQMMMGGFAPQPMQAQPGMIAQGGYALPQPGFVSPVDWGQQQQQAAQYAAGGAVAAVPPPPPPLPEGATPQQPVEAASDPQQADPPPPPPALPQQVPPEEPSTADPDGSVPLAAPASTGEAQPSGSVLHLLDNFKDAWEPYEPTDIPMFWHIPKAGGSSIKDSMGGCHRFVQATEFGVTDGHADDPEVAIVYPAVPGVADTDRSPFVNIDSTTVAGIQRAKELGFADAQLAQVVVSPFVFETNDLFTQTAKGRLFSVFRHPIDRAISMFYYIRVADWEPSYKPELQDWTIEQYATSDIVENNWMTRQLSNQLGGELTEENLKKAMEVVRNKFAVGLMTKIEPTMDRFEKMFRWTYHVNPPNQEACRERLMGGGANSNKANKKPVEEGSEAWNLLAHQNNFDLPLYQYIEQLFDEQESFVAGMPERFRMVDSTCCKCGPPTYPPEGFTCPEAVKNDGT